MRQNQKSGNIAFEVKDEYEDYINSIDIVLYSPEEILEKFTTEQLIRTLRYLNEELIFDLDQKILAHRIQKPHLPSDLKREPLLHDSQ